MTQNTSKDAVSPMFKVKHNGKEQINFVHCAKHKAGDPVFNVMGNLTGMTDTKSPVSNMKMFYQVKEGKTPELNFDIHLTKKEGEDEKYTLSNQPSPEEKEKLVHEKLSHLECELEQLQSQLVFIKRLRTEWNAQKVGLCNRRMKDKPSRMCGRYC